jgi:hypothetical protein
MALSNESTKHIHNLLNECFDHGFKNLDLKINHKIYMNFYTLFLKAQEYVDSLTIKNIKILPEMKKPSDYSYIIPTIRQHLENHVKKTFVFSFKLGVRTINIYLMHEKFITKQQQKQYIKDIIFWLYIVIQFPTQHCSTILNIFLFLSSLKKILPTDETEIKKEHINTGYTTTCSSISNIVIYRKEEWFKVFIHETIHNFGLDFSSHSFNKEITTKILSIFPVNSKVNLYEAYTDAWAKVINALIISFKNTNNKKDYITKSDFYIDMERIFSVFQTVKLLNFMGLKYNDLISTDLLVKKKYIENTNILSYYIITAILYNNISLFFDWCLQNNINMLQFNNSNIKFHLSFCDLIEHLHKAPTFLKQIKHKEEIYERMDKNLHFTQITLKSICSLY